MRIDRAFVTAARDFAANERNAINVRLSELTDGAITSVDQVQKLRAAINARGHQMATLGKRSVAAVLAHDPDESDQAIARTAPRRRPLERAEVRQDPRTTPATPTTGCAGPCTMYGAATGRWTSPGPMLHNLKRNELGVPLSVLDAVMPQRSRPYRAIRQSADRGRQRVARHAVRQARTSAVLGRLPHDREPGLGVGRRRRAQAGNSSRLRPHRRQEPRAVSGARRADAEQADRRDRRQRTPARQIRRARRRLRRRGRSLAAHLRRPAPRRRDRARQGQVARLHPKIVHVLASIVQGSADRRAACGPRCA